MFQDIQDYSVNELIHGRSSSSPRKPIPSLPRWGGREGREVVLEFTFLTAAKKRRVMEIAKVNGAISAYQTASLSSLSGSLSASERVGDSRGALFKTRGPQKNPGVFRVCAHTRASVDSSSSPAVAGDEKKPSRQREKSATNNFIFRDKARPLSGVAHRRKGVEGRVSLVSKQSAL